MKGDNKNTIDSIAAALEGALSKLPVEERYVLERMIISPVPCDVAGLCDMLHVSRSTLYRIRTRALKRLLVIMNV